MLSKSSAFHTIFAATLAAFLLAPCSSAATQTTLEPSSSPTVQDELLRMAGQAGVIFVGEVLTVSPHPSFTAGTGTVEVTFRVDQPIRGCDDQPTYTLREWSGLWTGGHQRYTPGQRLLVLLHSPSASGLSSPVGGQDGVMPIVGTGVSPRQNDATIAQAEPSVDLRWVQTRLPRVAAALQSSRLHSLAATPAYSGRERFSPAARRNGVSGTLRSLNPAPTPTPSLAESTSTLPLSPAASGGISLRSILSILGAWQAEQSHASR